MVRPDVLVLDEATSSVDSLTEVRISRALERLALGRTTISIAHRLSTASRADRVVMLESGRIVEDGSHASLMNANGKYAALYEVWLNSTNGESRD
jgi:putative ABC transport system ATP-binding protein